MPPNGNPNVGKSTPSQEQRQHGVKGVYYGGKWVSMTKSADEEHDIEDFMLTKNEKKNGTCRLYRTPCPRSRSRYRPTHGNDYDVCIIGAGCIGAAIARELSRYKLSILWLEVRIRNKHMSYFMC